MSPQLYVPPQLTSKNSFAGTVAPPQSPQHLTVASPRRPHECDPPLLIPRKTVSTGACVRWPELSLPQQTGLPSIVSPQVWLPPLAMALKVPAGGDNLPSASSPQQTGVPSARSAQVWRPPLLMAVNRSSGGVARPDSLLPQQTGTPSAVNPQTWLSPLLIAANSTPSGAIASSLPQQNGTPLPKSTQVCSSPLLTPNTGAGLSNCRGGTTDCPVASLPQQVKPSSAFKSTMHVCALPLLMNDGTCITNGSSGCGVSIPGSSGVGVCVGAGVGVSVGAGIGVAVGSGVGVAVGESAGVGVGVGVVGPSGVARASNCTNPGSGSPHAASMNSSRTAMAKGVGKRVWKIRIVARE